MKKTRVIILFGGRSAEHEISLLSARNVLAALDRERFEPVLVGIDRQGRWHRESERTLAAAAGDPRALALDAAAPAVGIEEGLVAPRSRPGGAVAGRRAAGDDVVVFPVLHGTFGEDGTVQGLLELARRRLRRRRRARLGVGMDKDVAKRLLRDAGIPIVDFAVVTAAAFARDPRGGAGGGRQRSGIPLFVKPANAGSSVGVTRVSAPERARAGGARGARLRSQGADRARRRRARDRMRGARQRRSGGLDPGRDPRPPPGRLLFVRRQVRRCRAAPAGRSRPISPAATAARVQTLAVATFRALELAGMARVDFFLARDDGPLYVNEVNTIPGFTAISMYPKMWEASGLSPTALVTRLIELAIERRDERRTRPVTAAHPHVASEGPSGDSPGP